MTHYLLDTNAFSALMREDPATKRRLEACGSDDRISICTIVRGEIRYGLARLDDGRKKEELTAKADSLFAAVSCEPIPEVAADEYGRIKREAERKGTPLDENDLWIAATALTLGATVVTSDSDFGGVAGLSRDNWAAPA